MASLQQYNDVEDSEEAWLKESPGISGLVWEECGEQYKLQFKRRRQSATRVGDPLAGAA